MSNVAVQKHSEETRLPEQCLEELLETEAGFDAREIEVKRNRVMCGSPSSAIASYSAAWSSPPPLTWRR